MRFTALYPLARTESVGTFADPDAVASIARCSENAGFDAIAFTEHPAPSEKWMAAGGHPALDPFSALAYCAAVTTQLRLQTYLTVLPFRNPFLTAKSAASVDVLSGGRLVMAAGTGYLRSEFLALGVDFEERNALLDEAVEVMRGIWTTANYSVVGRNFEARGQTAIPRPRQDPLPVWFGGNSRTARRRVAESGQGWTPLLTTPERARTTRTPALTIETLAEAIADLRHRLREHGRDPGAVTVQVEDVTRSTITHDMDFDAFRARVIELEQAGVHQMVVRPDGASLGAATSSIEAFGAELIGHRGTAPA